MPSFISERTEDETFRYPLIGLGLALLAVVATYLTIRFAPSPMGMAILIVGIIIIALAIAALMGARRGRAATFVAIALVLPYLIGGAAAYASAQRVVSEIDGIFEADEPDPEGSSNDGSPEDYVDDNEDGTDDWFYEGTNCSNTNPYEGYLDQCAANGGLESAVGRR